MFAYSDLFSSVSVVLLIIGGSILIGQLLNQAIGKITGKMNPVDIFWKFLVGLLFLVSIYGIVVARGMSILLPLPLLLVLFLRHKMNAVPPIEVPIRKDIGFLVLSIVVNVIFYFIAFHSFDAQNVKFVYGDFNIYYRIATCVNAFGVETSNLDSLTAPSNIGAYHFGDIWFYAMIARLTSGNPSKVFFIAFTVLTSLFVTGIYTHLKQSFYRHISGNRAYLYLLALAGLFNGFAFLFPTFLFTADVYLLSVANWGKIIIQSCFIIGLMKLARPGEWRAFVLLAVMAALSFINTMPAIYTATFLLLTINVLFKRLSWKEWFRLNAFYVLFSGIFFLLLYKVAAPYFGYHDTETSAPSGMLEKFTSFQYFRTALAIFVGGWFQLFTIIPYVVVLLAGLALSKQLKSVYSVKRFENDIIFLVLMFASGLLCWAALHPVAVDTVQFFHNIIASLYAIGISFIFIYIAIVVKNKVLTMITAVLMCASVWVNKDNIFYVTDFKTAEANKMDVYFKDEKGDQVLASLQAKSYFNTFFNKNTNYYIPLAILNYKWPAYTSLSLNAPFIPINEQNVYVSEERKIVASAPFSKYYKAHHDAATGTDASDLSLEFLKANRVKFLSVSRDTVLPGVFRPLVQDSLVLADPAYTIYKLNL